MNSARGWWLDKNLVKLARRTAFKETNEDEFDQAVAFCREKNLSPMSGQLYAFVFNKDDAKKRNMVIVTSIMGYRAIANRSGDYMPGPTKAFFDPGAKNSLINPRGLVRAEGGADRFIHGGWKNVTEEALWESFAPIIKSGSDDDAYEWVDTGEVWADSGKPKKKRRLRQGAEVQEILDPKKEGWHRMPDVMLKKCAEAAALRRGWPEDLSGLYVEEEVHRSQVIDADYVDLTPSEMVAKAETDARIEKIGGPSIFAAFDAAGTLERVEIGKFFDRVDAHTRNLKPEDVASFAVRNREALREFWGRAKNDALTLKTILETRSSAATPASQANGHDGAAGTAAPRSESQTDSGPDTGAADPSLSSDAAAKLKSALLADVAQLRTRSDFDSWERDAKAHLEKLPEQMRSEVQAELDHRRADIR
ncbi:hypothetical protein BRAS3843_1480047 [Bradyrhizobium sp. STM 3843]|nr:hypothetical protein BRAS3843_1480047 [Bradyrhizobium sp. STM 3843]